MSLTLYKKKRNFRNTPEPKGKKEKRHPKLSFVIQKHHASHLHYDFRLEMEGVLKSWAVPKGPSMIAGEKRLAVMVEDHPLPYGKFYGEIPEGNYGAGMVEIWDNGTYTTMEKSDDPEKTLLAQLKKGDLKFTMHGKHLKGSFALVRMHGQEKNWLLIKKSDEFSVKKYDIEKIGSLKAKKKTLKKKLTVKKKVTKEPELKRNKFPADIPKPMLARQSKEVIDKADWFYETKYDGYRIIAKINNNKAELYSRNGNSYTGKFETITKELKHTNNSIILDGEVVIKDKKGLSNFQLLQNYQTTGKGTLKYFVFDILYLNGHDLKELTLSQRRELLEEFFNNNNFKNIFISQLQIGNGKKLFEKLSAKGYEGIIAKDPESLYIEGRRAETWLKIKSNMMQEAIICGYTAPQKSRSHFGSILLGMYKGKKLVYIGNCGTGFTEESLKELNDDFQRLRIGKSPFDPVPKLVGAKGKIFWIKPKLVCNIKFTEWTQDEHMRHPVFMGLRDDKKITEVINESADETRNVKSENNEKEKEISSGKIKVKCTNLAKIFFPEEGYTKGDIINYYQRISKYILPYLKDRPQSLNRHPNGISGLSFYQKDMEVKQLPSFAKTEKVYSKSNEAYIDYLICNDEATLIYMANLGCIEINPWHSTYQKADYPTWMMLDLDPGKIEFKHVVDTALVIKEICDEIKIDCYCKTSGATGLHVYIPLGAKYTYDEIKLFAEILAGIVHQRLPGTTSIERSTSKRKDKIYVDFLQNRKGQTIAAPYSVRPKPHATVSAPLLWKEVDHNLTPQQFTIGNIEKRLSRVGDLWKPVLQKGITISQAFKAIEKL
jgi:bifunctional non-homologous end joining protein LigD